MQLDPRLQIRLGLAVCVLATLCAVIMAFVPDPFFRNRLFETSVDDADGIASGIPVSFMGGVVGKVRWVRLDARRSVYNVGLDVRKDWTIPPCAVVRIAAANPLTAPKIEVAALGQGVPASAQTCGAFRTAIACVPIAAPITAKAPLLGCVRQGDLTQLIARAIAQATSAITQGQTLIARLEALTGGKSGAAGGGELDLKALAANVTETSQSVNAIARKIDGTLTPERQQDLGAVIGNFRKLSGKAADFDTASVQTTVSRTNALLEQTTALLKDNRESIQTLAAQGAGATQEGRDTLSALQTSLQSTTSNLERMSANLDAITERLKGDPGYLLKGQRLADPPNPGVKP